MEGKEALCRASLQKLTGKKRIIFVKRGNSAIKLILKLAKKLGYKEVLLQDQGGWLTYPQFCKKEKLIATILKTDLGLVDPKDLENHKGTVLLLNSMAAYAATHDMKKIASVCEKNSILLVNDISGSIGRDAAKHGDIVFASFGEEKPVELGKGGFIATDSGEHAAFFEENREEFSIDHSLLDEKLDSLQTRLKSFDSARKKVMKDLAGFDIIHRDKDGINVIVRFKTNEEKERLINYCGKEGLEFTLCPKMIKVNVDAVSIEIKRLKC